MWHLENLVEAPRGTPTQPAHQLLVGTPGLRQLVLSLTTHLRGKKGFTPRSLEKLSKAGFFSWPSFLDMAVRCILGKVKCFFGCQNCAPHILEPRSCKILAFSLGSLVMPYGELCNSLETTQRNSAWSSLP